MKFKSLILYLVLIPALAFSQVDCPTEQVLVKGGEYIPLYNDSINKKLSVEDFKMDITPVTNAQFLAFVKENPEWRKSKVKALFAEGTYLSHWKSDTILGPEAPPESPVTQVSWFAAKAYCQWCGGQLPTTKQWEYAAQASETMKNGYEDQEFKSRLLGMYEKRPSIPLPPVKSSFKNYWGIYDLHGMTWEWTSDFNTVLLSGESRKDNTLDRNLFCAAGSIGSVDPANYAAFMRYAFRGSLKAKYTIKNLGFRCVKNNSDEKIN